MKWIRERKGWHSTVVVEETGSMCNWEVVACVGCQLLFIPCDLSHFALFEGFSFNRLCEILVEGG